MPAVDQLEIIELAALLIIILIALIATLLDYKIGVIIAVILLPLSMTRLLPRELFGIKGMNPLNVVLAASCFSLFLVAAFQPKKIRLPRLSRQFWVYISAMA